MASPLSSRKWLVTINNPLDHGFTHDEIIKRLSSLRGNSLYWCFCDEEGDECETRHTHVFIYRHSNYHGDSWERDYLSAAT